jgi:hypothetical protein
MKRLTKQQRQKMVDHLVQCDYDAQQDEKLSDTVEVLASMGVNESECTGLLNGGDHQDALELYCELLHKSYAKTSDKALIDEYIEQTNLVED